MHSTYSPLKWLFKLSIPMILQGIISFGLGMTDTIMLGSIGEEAISASAIANQPVNIFITAVGGLGSGATILISQYWGSQQMEKIKRVISLSLKLVEGLGLLFFVACLLFAPQIISLFSSDSLVNESAQDYLRIIMFSFLFSGMSSILAASYRGVESVNIGLGVMCCSFSTNILMNWILIFGKFGFPALGVQGAALGTLISRAFEFCLVIIYLYFIDKKIKFRLRDLRGKMAVVRRQYFKYGVPVLFNDFMWSVALSVQMAVLSNLGTDVLAANSICNVITQFVFVFVYSMGNASTVLIGKTVGTQDKVLLKQCTKTLQISYVIVGIAGGLLMVLLRELILLPFNVSGNTREIALQFILTAATLMPVMAYTAPSMIGILRGGGDSTFVLCMDLLLVWLVAIPAGWIGGYLLKLPFWVVYLLLKLDEPVKFFIVSIRIKRFHWVKNLALEK